MLHKHLKALWLTQALFENIFVDRLCSDYSQTYTQADDYFQLQSATHTFDTNWHNMYVRGFDLTLPTLVSDDDCCVHFKICFKAYSCTSGLTCNIHIGIVLANTLHTNVFHIGYRGLDVPASTVYGEYMIAEYNGAVIPASPYDFDSGNLSIDPTVYNILDIKVYLSSNGIQSAYKVLYTFNNVVKYTIIIPQKSTALYSVNHAAIILASETKATSGTKSGVSTPIAFKEMLLEVM